jgi:nicotinamidase-related amidase
MPVAGAALLLIDFQRDFCDPGGYADQLGGVAWAQEILPRAERLLAAARARGLPVFHTREGYAPDLSDCHPQRRLRSRRAGAEIGSHGPLGRLLIRGQPGQDIVARLAPRPGEVVLDKPSYGAFATTPLERLLREQRVSTLYLAGVTADVCVHTTLREAIDRGFDCRYVRDAISTFDPDLRRACERMVEMEGGVWGELVTSDDAISHWTQESG